MGDVYILFDMSFDLEKTRAILIRFIYIIAAVSLMSFGLAFLLSSRLQYLISRPILRLKEAMKTVTDKSDYAVRLKPTSDDELGARMVAVI